MSQKQFDKILLCLSIICSLIILKMKFFNFPFNWFGLTENAIANTNDILFNLSVGIIASYIFYVINIQIVTNIREKNTRKLINDYLVDIVTQMQVGQLYLKKTYFANKDFNTLTENDFRNLTTLGNAAINFRYNQTNSLGAVINSSTGTLSEQDLFFEEMLLVKDNIGIIFSFPFISSTDYNLINLLHKIKSGFFYIGVNRIHQGSAYLNFEKYIYEHYKNFKELKIFVTPRVATV